jgi:hypothetical protein
MGHRLVGSRNRASRTASRLLTRDRCHRDLDIEPRLPSSAVAPRDFNANPRLLNTHPKPTDIATE